jgi:hypothetical protein
MACLLKLRHVDLGLVLRWVDLEGRLDIVNRSLFVSVDLKLWLNVSLIVLTDVKPIQTKQTHCSTL